MLCLYVSLLWECTGSFSLFFCLSPLISCNDSMKINHYTIYIVWHLIRLKEKGFILFVVTARQFKEKVCSQLRLFGWENIFHEVLVTEQKNKKEELMKPHLSLCNDNWIIGDTGMDISVGKKLGIKTVAVLSGFQNLAVLSAYKPDYILKNIKEFDPSNKIDFK